jgi:hypothetical protein
MLANVHLAANDTDVWVEAEVRCSDPDPQVVAG